MGIKNGSKIFSDIAININIERFSGKTVAIDMMTYIIRKYIMFNGKSKSSKAWYMDVINFLKEFTDNKIRFICVFDGENENKPPEKQICINNRIKTHTNYSIQNLNKQLQVLDEIKNLSHGDKDKILQKYPDMSQNEILKMLTKLSKKFEKRQCFPSKLEIKNLIMHIQLMIEMEYFNMPGEPCKLLIANGEAESLCCSLLENNIVDTVISEDSDVLLYLSMIKLKNPSRDLYFITSLNSNSAMQIKLDRVLEFHQCTVEELISLCFICGTDYNTGLDNLGVKKGLKYIKKNSIDIIKEKITIYDRLCEIFNPDSKFNVITMTQEEKDSILQNFS